PEQVCARGFVSDADGGMMASSSMDETMSETEPAAEGAPVHAEEVPEALPAAEFDATPWPVPTRPAPRPVRISRPLGPRLWTAALAGALLFTAGGEQERAREGGRPQ